MTELWRKLHEGTEVLRTGGGARLTASECNVLLDLAKAARGAIQFSTDEAGTPWVAGNPSGATALAQAVSAYDACGVPLSQRGSES